jgi:xylose dehydrogenase (NAD/NADP)
MEGFMYCHHPQIKKARELIADGAVGRVNSLSARFTFPVDPVSDNWRADPSRGGGSMMDQACYMVNALNLFGGGAPERVFCATERRKENGLEIAHYGTMLYANGLVGQFASSQAETWREELQVYGSEGTLVIPFLLLPFNKKTTHSIEIQGDSRVPHEAKHFDCGQENSYHLQLENVYDCLFEDGTPVMPLEQSVENLHAISALFESAEKGCLVPVK